MDQIPHLESQKKVAPIPVIYSLIETGASTQSVVQQLYSDFYSPDRDSEKIFLAIDELQRRDAEGVAAMTYLSNGTDELGSFMKRVMLQEAKGPELEKLLGIERAKNIINTKDMASIEQLVRLAYDHAVSKGYTKKTFKECLEQVRRMDRRKSEDLPPHLAGTIDEEVVSASATFGADEPGYLELIGPREILRLRSMKNPSFLLLGSYGAYSAAEFREYTAKINPQNKSYIIDIDDTSINLLKQDSLNKGNLVQGDAMSLPYQPSILDQIYTNKLTGFLENGLASVDAFNVNMGKIFRESFRVLKSGGSLIMSEDLPEELFSGQEDSELFFRKLLSLAKQTGFKIERRNSGLSFMVRKEIGTTTIDEKGFPHYGDSLLFKNAGSFSFYVRLIKP